MTPFERAFALHPSANEFLGVMEAHLAHGRIISTDRIFLMVRPVWRDWPEDRLLDPWEHDDEGDSWFCWDLAGDIQVLRELPKSWLGERKYILSHTNGRLRTMRGSRFLGIKMC